MSHSLDCEVLVVGAGPAGSACAQLLARAGLDVLLVDQHDFPRDKVCGDGLIPDAHRALERLGVLPEVLARARAAQHVGCIGPRGGRVDVPGTLAVLPRRELDDIVRRAALASGARWLAPARFEAPLMHDAVRVGGACLRRGDGTPLKVRAGWTVLATGAVPAAMIAAGLCERRTPTGVALRGYFRHPALAERLQALEVVWHRRLRGGYGWVFPAPDGLFNVGVGMANATDPDAREFNLRQMFEAFCEVHAPARELAQGGQALGALKGAPLRCSLGGARWSRPGLLATGEAVGSTYSFTGEGIGKALETGMLAAEALREGRAAGQPDDTVLAHYEAALARLRPRFALYEKANRINHHPWLADLIIWRARRSQRAINKARAVLDESGNPAELVSARGVLRLLLARG